MKISTFEKKIRKAMYKKSSKANLLSQVTRRVHGQAHQEVTMMITIRGDLHQEQESGLEQDLGLEQVRQVTSGRKTPKKDPRLNIQSQIFLSTALQDKNTSRTEVLLILPRSKPHKLHLEITRNILQFLERQNLESNPV